PDPDDQMVIDNEDANRIWVFHGTVGSVLLSDIDSGRHIHYDFGAASGSRADFELAAHLSGALAHSQQSEMGSVGGRHLREVEALSVILYAQGYALRPVVQLDADYFCARIFH